MDPRLALSSEGSEMEQDEEAGAEALRGRDKILCYINMQSPGKAAAGA